MCKRGNVEGQHQKQKRFPASIFNVPCVSPLKSYIVALVQLPPLHIEKERLQAFRFPARVFIVNSDHAFDCNFFSHFFLPLMVATWGLKFRFSSYFPFRSQPAMTPQDVPETRSFTACQIKPAWFKEHAISVFGFHGPTEWEAPSVRETTEGHCTPDVATGSRRHPAARAYAGGACTFAVHRH